MAAPSAVTRRSSSPHLLILHRKDIDISRLPASIGPDGIIERMAKRSAGELDRNRSLNVFRSPLRRLLDCSGGVFTGPVKPRRRLFHPLDLAMSTSSGQSVSDPSTRSRPAASANARKSRSRVRRGIPPSIQLCAINASPRRPLRRFASTFARNTPARCQ